MKLKIIPAVFSLLALFTVCTLPRASGGIGSGSFEIMITAGNWDIRIINVQFTSDGAPVGPLYAVMQDIPIGTTKTIRPFTPGDNPNSLEIIHYFDGEIYVYIIPPEWQGEGLEMDKTYTLITAIGEPLTYPLIEEPVLGDTRITVSSYQSPHSDTWPGGYCQRARTRERVW